MKRFSRTILKAAGGECGLGRFEVNGPPAAAVECLRQCHSHVVKSPYTPVAVPPVSVTDYVWAGLGAVGERTAFIAADTGSSVCYSELRSRCRGLATWLNDELPPHSVVAVLLPNSVEFAVAALGGLESGHVVSALHPDFTEDELARLLRITDTRCIITTSKKIFTVLETKAMLEKESGREFPIKMISVDRDVRFSGVYYLDELVKNEREMGVGRSDAPALMLTNSGGSTKGLTHGSLVASCRQVSWVTQAEAKVAAFPPMHSLYGMAQVLLQGLSRGATLVTMGNLGPEHLVRAIKQHGVTSIPAVAGLARYLASGNVSRTDLSGIHSMTVPSPLPTKQLKRLLSLLSPDAELAQLYPAAGGGMVFHLPRNELRPGSVGRPLPSTEAKVVGEGGSELGVSSPGEICVRGPQLSTDDWVRTGDIGYYDSDGFFYLTGRTGESAIESGTGLQVYPSELESVLCRHPDVKEAAVLEANCPTKGRASIAVVVPTKVASPPPPKELLNFVEEHVAPHKWISRVIFTDKLPKLPNGSLDREQVKKLWASQQEQEIVAFSYI